MLDFVLVMVLAVCVYTDIRFKRIYNAVLVPAVAVALIGNIYTGGLDGGMACIKGLLLGMGLLYIPFALGGMGAGDVKLLGVIGAFKGPQFVWLTFLAGAVTGGLVSLVVMAVSGRFRQSINAVVYTVLSIFRVVPRVNMIGAIGDGCPHLTFPYGIAIAAGVLAAYMMG